MRGAHRRVRVDWPGMAALPQDTLLDLALPVPHQAPDPRLAHGEVLLLFDECRGGVHRYVRSLGIGVSDTEDVVQETFLALHRHLLRNGNRSNLRGWVFRVARNLALKRRARRSWSARIVFAAAVVEDPIDPASNPEERLLAGQRQSHLQAVVRALPDRDRQCLELRAEGLRYREIAGVLGVSVGTVASSLARAVTRVRRADERPESAP